MPAPNISPQPGQSQAANTPAKGTPAAPPSAVARAEAKAAPPTPDPLIAGHDLDVGTFYYNRGDYVGALSRFQDAIYNDPTDPEAYCRDGDTELKLKHPLRAQAAWQRCLKLAESGKWAEHAQKQLRNHPAAAPPKS